MNFDMENSSDSRSLNLCTRKMEIIGDKVKFNELTKVSGDKSKTFTIENILKSDYNCSKKYKQKQQENGIVQGLNSPFSFTSTAFNRSVLESLTKPSTFNNPTSTLESLSLDYHQWKSMWQHPGYLVGFQGKYLDN